MTEREQFIEDWRAIITGLLPDLPEEELEARMKKLIDRYDMEHSESRSGTASRG